MSVIKLDINSDILPDIEQTKVYHFEIDSIDNEQLKSFILDLETKQQSLQTNNIGGWRSPNNLFDNTDPEIQKLKKIIINCVAKIHKKAVQIRHSWANIIRKTNAFRKHSHPCNIVVCYYVTTNKNSDGEFVICDTNIKIQPQTGMLLIFPNSLYHEVLPYSGNDERISIACNIN